MNSSISVSNAEKPIPDFQNFNSAIAKSPQQGRGIASRIVRLFKVNNPMITRNNSKDHLLLATEKSQSYSSITSVPQVKSRQDHENKHAASSRRSALRYNTDNTLYLPPTGPEEKILRRQNLSETNSAMSSEKYFSFSFEAMRNGKKLEKPSSKATMDYKVSRSYSLDHCSKVSISPSQSRQKSNLRRQTMDNASLTSDKSPTHISIGSTELINSKPLEMKSSRLDTKCLVANDRKLLRDAEHPQFLCERADDKDKLDCLESTKNATTSKAPSSTTVSANEDLLILTCLSNPNYIIQTMLSNPLSPEIQIEACRILSSQVPPSYNATLLCGEEQSLFRAIMDAINNHQTDEAVQEMAHKFLSLIPFAQKEEIASLEYYGGVKRILSSMKDFPENSNLQQYGCTTLSKISLFDRISLDIFQCGGIRVLVYVMTAHSLDVIVQEMACLTLLNVCRSNHLIQQAVCEDRGFDTVSIAMALHPTALRVQELGCRTLRQLSSNHGDNEHVIDVSGGIDSIINAMQVHLEELNLQKEACHVLINLAFSAKNKKKICESFGVVAIVNAMWAHQNDAELQNLACRTLWELSISPQNQDLIAQSNGIKAVISAMRDHADHAGIQGNGCGCLANLATNSEENERIIVEEEGIDAIIMAMVLHPEARVVQEKAVNCLRKLAYEPHLDALRATGVVTLVELAAEKFPSNCRLVADQVLLLLQK